MNHTTTTTTLSIHCSYPVAMLALQQAIADGWEIDPDNLPEPIGFAYALTLVRKRIPAIETASAEKPRAAKVKKALDTTQTEGINE